MTPQNALIASELSPFLQCGIEFNLINSFMFFPAQILQQSEAAPLAVAGIEPHVHLRSHDVGMFGRARPSRIRAAYPFLCVTL